MVRRKIILLHSAILLLFIISNGYADELGDTNGTPKEEDPIKVHNIKTPVLLVNEDVNQAKLQNLVGSISGWQHIGIPFESSHHSTHVTRSSTHVPTTHSSTHVTRSSTHESTTHSSTHKPTTHTSTHVTRSSTHEPTTHSSTHKPTTHSSTHVTRSSTHEPTTHTSTHKPTTHTSTHKPTTHTSTHKPTTHSSTHKPTTHSSTHATRSSTHAPSTRHSTTKTRTTHHTRASTARTTKQTTRHTRTSTARPSKRTTHAPSSTRRHKASTTTHVTTTANYPYTPYVPKDNDYYYYDRKGKYRSRGGYDDSYDRSDEYDRDRDDSRGDYNDKEDMYASMTIWIRDADNWENPRYRDKYQGQNYNKDRDYNKGKDYKGVKFPVRRYKNIRHFPRERFSPLVSIMPWLPIFYDRITYQTFIFSPTGGIYILPPLINFYGRRFAVAQLIKWGYASLVSSGAPPPPNVNVAPLVQPAPPPPPVPAAVPVAGGGAVFDKKREQFVGGVKTDHANFEPRYKQTVRDGGRGYGSGGYGSGGNYGGTGRQEVYAQGGPQRGGYN